MTNYTLSGNGQSFTSATQPTYDGSFRMWRCTSASGAAFNVQDLTGATFTVSGGPSNYVILLPADFLNFVRQAAGLTSAQVLAMRSDTNADLQYFWLLFDNLKVGVERDSTVTQQGWAILQATGHLTSAQVAAINAAWPTA